MSQLSHPTLREESEKILQKAQEGGASSAITVLTIISIIIQLIKLYKTCNKAGDFHDNAKGLGRLESVLVHRMIKKAVPDAKDSAIIELAILDYLKTSKKQTMNTIYGEV